MNRFDKKGAPRARPFTLGAVSLALAISACSGSSVSDFVDEPGTTSAPTTLPAAPTTTQTLADQGSAEDDVVEEFLTLFGEEVQSWGVSESSWACVEAGLEEGGYVAQLEGMEFDAFLFLDEDAPLADTPPEFRQFMEGMFIYLFDPQQGCLRPSEITAAQQYLGAAPEGPLTYGSDPTLDMLYDGCGAGSLADCDMLFLGSEIGSEYEDYSLTCGGTTEPMDANISTCMLDQQDLSELSDLIAQCESGFYLACDVVYATTLVGSAEEEIGASCGGIRDPEDVVPCWITYGMGTR